MIADPSEFAAAVPRGRIERPGEILEVRADGDAVVATMRWAKYRHPIDVRLRIEDVMVEGDEFDPSEHSPGMWASESVQFFWWAAESGLLESRRTVVDGRITIDPLDDSVDPRFTASGVDAQDDSRWRELASFATPTTPPRAVEGWKADGSLIAWHVLQYNHTYVVPALDHAASRWVDDSCAHVEVFELPEGLPATARLMLVADAVLGATWRGAARVTTDVFEHLPLLGFHDNDGFPSTDDRLVGVDLVGVAQLASESGGWRPHAALRQQMAEADAATYVAR